MRSRLRRGIICFVLAFSLLAPAPNALASQIVAATNAAASVVDGPIHSVALLLKWLLQSESRPRRESLADRAAQVSQIAVAPPKLVAYQDMQVPFSAIAANASGLTVQGVKFEWSSSDETKVRIDDSGMASFGEPGEAQVICRAGTVEVSVPVVVREGARPGQTNQQWDSDQSWRPDVGRLQPATTSGSSGQTEDDALSAGSIINSVIDKLVPTVEAQNGGTPLGDSSDFGYDELWNDTANAVGHPRNRPVEGMRIGTVLPEQNNFNFAIPIYGLPGRGPGANITLRYYSRVWSKHGSAVTFNAVNAFPFAGFSLGFGRILTYGSGSNTKYVLVDPDGTRRYLGTGYDSISSTYQTSDGSHITFVGSKNNGGALYFNDGTKVTISVINNLLLVSRIRDRNGNYVSLAYKTYGSSNFPWRQALSQVSDTLGRLIEFQYDSSGNLISITGPGFGGTAQNPVTQTLARFDYADVSISNSFSGLTVENLPSTQVTALKHVFFPATETGYLFSYSAYGVIYNVSLRRQMSYNSGTGAISDGTQNAYVSFNYPTSASFLTDVPTFSQRTESPGGNYSYSHSTDGTAQTKTVTITRPDLSQVLLTRSTNTSSVANNFLVKSEVKNSSGTVMAKTEFAYASDSGGSPQVQAITSYNDANVPAKTDFDYDSYGNPVNIRAYGFQISGAWQVRRRQNFVYKTDTSYLNQYLRSLVIEQKLYDALSNTSDSDDVVIAKSTTTYDDYNALSGMEGYTGEAEAPGHETSFNTSFTVRGNITGTTVYKDVQASQTIARLRKLDKYGNVLKEQLSCCIERTYVNEESNGYLSPMSITSGSGSGALTSTREEDFNTSLTTSATNPRNQTTTIEYESALRVAEVTYPSGATRTANYDDSALSASQSAKHTEGGSNKTVTTTAEYDGWGRVIEQIAPNGGQVNTSYDSMGRVQSVTNPFESGQTPGADTEYAYDALGRVTVTTLPDNQTIQTAYNGASVTVTDQVNRQTKRETDGLGRLVKVVEQNSSGTLNQETTYTYNLMDDLTEVNQGGQLRKFKYDSLGRMLFERIPEQSATINDGTGTMWSCKFTYTDQNQVDTRTDARGVITTYGYDSLNRMSSISYNTSGASGVATTPNVTYTYDTSSSSSTFGLLLSVSVGTQSSESYEYDSLNRLSSITRTIGSQSYETGYEYNSAGQLTQLTYPSTRAVNMNHDSIGRLSSLVNDSDSSNYLSSLTYNWADQMTGRTLGSNIVETFGYSSDRLQLTSQTATQNSNTRLSLTYSYQASSGQMGSGSTAGNAGQLMSISGSIGGLTESASFTYDLQRRIVTSSQTTNGTSIQRRFAYDRWGNRTGVWDATTGGTQIQSVSLTQSGGVPTNQITSVTTSGTQSYTYDAAGNLTNDGVNTWVYDAENRIVSRNSGTDQFQYDHANRRIKKTSSASGATIHYVWQGSQVIAEHNSSSGAVIVDYIYAGGRMIAKEESGRSFFLNDRLSVRAVITDGQGGIQGRQAHLPFGEQIGTSGQQDKHAFTSYEKDTESGTEYAMNRQYSSVVGRFQQADPYEPSSHLVDPQSWNRYAYTRNNAINRIDPFGLYDQETGGGDYVIPREFVVSINGAIKEITSGVSRGGGTGDEIEIVIDEGAGAGRPLDPIQVDPFQGVRNAFLQFLDHLPEGCANDPLIQANLAGVRQAIGSVNFFDLDSVLPDGARLGDQQAQGYVGRRANPGETLDQWFRRSRGGEIANGATATWNNNGPDLPTDGIYFAGSVTQFAGGNLRLLLHEVWHIVTKEDDAQLVNDFMIRRRENETPSQALSRFFNSGCTER